jgi:carbonic anhydrase
MSMRNERAREALEILLAGNHRYAEARLEHPHQTKERRAGITGGQTPIAAVLGCADSRVPPEVIFDQGLGDLFVVRVAGNVLDPVVVESLEYAAHHLDVPLVLVLGHTSCGAVTAVARSRDAEERPSRLSEFIMPAVDQAAGEEGEIVENACRGNIRRVSDELATESITLSMRVEDGELDIVPAYYDLATGKVDLL